MPIEATKTISVSAGASGTSTEWIPLNLYAVPFNVGFGVDLSVASAATFRVEHTFTGPSAASVVFVHEDVSAAVANIDGNYAFPVRATRLTIASVVSAGATGTINFNVLQTGL